METPDFTWLFLKMIAGLVLVLVLAVVLVRFVLPRSRMGRGLFGRKGAELAKVLDRIPVEPRKNLYVVKLLERYLLLGGSEHSLNLITELSRSEGEKFENNA